MNQFDPNKFDPGKNLNQPNVNPNRQGGGNQKDAPAEKAADNAPGGDPYSSLKMDPSQLMSLLSAQAKYNLHDSNIENTPLNESMQAFSKAVTPDIHARLSKAISLAYNEEFGKTPTPEVLQNVLDNYLIGTPVIEA